MNEKVRRILPIFLSIVSSAGVIGTAILVAKETPKASKEIEEAKKEKNSKKVAKAILKNYGPSIAVGAATITSIVAGTIIGKKTEASLTATTIMLDRTYRKYKGKVKEVLGVEKEAEINKEIAKDDYKKKEEELNSYENSDGTKLYHEEHIGFFRAKPELLERALNLTNERIQSTYDDIKYGMRTNMYASLKTFLDDAKAKVIDKKEIDDLSFDYGWSYDYLDEAWGGNKFVHMILTPEGDENGVVKYINVTFDKDPIYGVESMIPKDLYGYNLNDINDGFRLDFDDGFNEEAYVKKINHKGEENE